MMQQQRTQRQRSHPRPHEQRQRRQQQRQCKRRRGSRNDDDYADKRVRICSGGAREIPMFAGGDLHETTAQRTAPMLASHTMHRRPAQHTQQPIGPAGAGCPVSSSAGAANSQQRRRRPRRQRPYSGYSPRKFFIQQMMSQIRQPTTDQLAHSVPGQLASSSLARELWMQRMGPTQAAMNRPAPIVATTATAATTTTNDAMMAIKSKSKIHQWHWIEPDATQERLLSDDKLEVCFHPECAESTAAIRGSQPFRLNGNYYYWEVTIYDKIFGTSMMLGLCTEDQALRKSDYCNLVGLDQNGWSLSHKGLIWHDGKYSHYTNDLTTNQTLTVGLLFDTMRGELSYYINGENLGVAFSGLNNCPKDLYPVVGSTAKRTRMRITASYCGYVSLFERTCYTILKSIKNEAELVQTLQQNKLPRRLIEHMAELAEVCRSQTEKNTAKSAQCIIEQ